MVIRNAIIIAVIRNQLGSVEIPNLTDHLGAILRDRAPSAPFARAIYRGIELNYRGSQERGGKKWERKRTKR